MKIGNDQCGSDYFQCAVYLLSRGGNLYFPASPPSNNQGVRGMRYV